MSELQEFLRRSAPAQAAEQVPPEPVEPAPEEQVAPEAPTPEQPEQRRDGMVPRGALDAERAERRDWKEKAIRAEAERDAERRALEAERKEREALQARYATLEATQRTAQQPATPPEPPKQVELPDPSRDPAGYARVVRQIAQHDAMQFAEHQRLNGLQADLEDEHGKEAVVMAYQAFQAAAERDPALNAQVRSARNPWKAMWKWASDNSPRVKLLAEIGPDPDAWRNQERERLRAEMASSAQQPAQQPAPAVPSTPSLAAARSAGPRDTGGYTGPKSLGQIIGR